MSAEEGPDSGRRSRCNGTLGACACCRDYAASAASILEDLKGSDEGPGVG